MNLIFIEGKIYNCLIEDLKKLKFLQEKWTVARDNESYNEDDLSEELYRLEQQVIKRSSLVGVAKYKA